MADETTAETPAVELAAEPGLLPFACLTDTATDDEAFAALPECTACDGSGKDDHGTVFEAPFAIHFAGPPVEIMGHRRQLCMWCGHVLLDTTRLGGSEHVPAWPDGALVRIEDGIARVEPYDAGTALPAACCARSDAERQNAELGHVFQGIANAVGTTSAGVVEALADMVAEDQATVEEADDA